MRKITTKAQQEERLARYNRLLAERPGLSPACKRALWSAATKQTLYPEQRTRAWGLAMRGKRAAKACHEAQRRKGVIPGSKGLLVMQRSAAGIRQQRQRDRNLGEFSRKGYAGLVGI